MSFFDWLGGRLAIADKVGERSMPAKKKPETRTITNCCPGTRLHLGDGRVLEHGESAEVSAEIAHNLTKRGQAE